MIPLRLTTSPLTATFSNSALTRVCFLPLDIGDPVRG